MTRIALCSALAIVLPAAGLGCSHAPPAPPKPEIAYPDPSTVLGCANDPACSGQIDHQEGTFITHDGLKLYEQSWRPKSGHVRAVLVIVHGLKDYSGHYALVAEQLASTGFAVHAFDLRGHGKSEGDRVWVDAFSEYLDDLDLFQARVRLAEGDKPLFLFGHSMGGAIVTADVLQRHPPIAGFILSGPALKPGDDVSGFLIAVTKVLGSVTPHLAVLDLPSSGFSKDPAVVEGMDHDPLICQSPGPARTASELLGTMAYIGDNMEKVQLPFLVLHGEADHVTNPEGSRELVKRAASTDKTLKTYPGMLHDLLHEPERGVVYQDLSAWLAAHAPATT